VVLGPIMPIDGAPLLVKPGVTIFNPDDPLGLEKLPTGKEMDAPDPQNLLREPMPPAAPQPMQPVVKNQAPKPAVSQKASAKSAATEPAQAAKPAVPAAAQVKLPEFDPTGVPSEEELLAGPDPGASSQATAAAPAQAKPVEAPAQTQKASAPPAEPEPMATVEPAETPAPSTPLPNPDASDAPMINPADLQ